MAFVDRVTAARPAIGATDWGPTLDNYLAKVEEALENLETGSSGGAAPQPYTLRGYIRPSQTATLPADLPDGAVILVPLAD